MLALKVGGVLTPHRRFGESYILIEEGKIAQVAVERPRFVDEVHSYDGCMAVPGFVDLHMHGCFGIDVMNASSMRLRELAERLPATGVTSFMPSTVSDDFSRLSSVIENVRVASEARIGAQVLGVHLEGPYLNAENRGAHLLDQIRPPSIEEFKALYGKSQGLLKRVTVAPEVVGGLGFIEDVSARFDVTVSIGHTNATFDEAFEAFDRGAKIVTHLFNGMRKLDHREPGVAGAALTRADVFVEAIVDLVHLHPATVRLIHRCKGAKRMLLVTDAMAAAGLSDGLYRLGRTQVSVKDGVARLGDGVLAGSALTMIQAVKNAVKVGIPLRDALAMASDSPCEAMKFKGKGRLEQGFDADILILDRRLNLVSTYVGGKKHFDRDGGAHQLEDVG